MWSRICSVRPPCETVVNALLGGMFYGRNRRSPVATKRDIEHQLLWREELCELASVRDRECSRWRAPLRDIDGIGRGRRDGRRDIGPAPKPHAEKGSEEAIRHASHDRAACSEKIGCSQDSSYIELRRPHASSCSSEALAKAVRLCLLDDTARVLAAVSP